MSEAPVKLDPAVLATALSVLAEEIEELGLALCMDPAIAARHSMALQSIDYIAQRQRVLASVVKSDCAVCAINAVELEALKDWLLGSCPEGQCGH